MSKDLGDPRPYVYYDSDICVVSPLGKSICGQDRQNRLGCVEELLQLTVSSAMMTDLNQPHGSKRVENIIIRKP